MTMIAMTIGTATASQNLYWTMNSMMSDEVIGLLPKFTRKLR